MYLAVDVGGSKTLFAVFSHNGQILTKYKIPTNPNYKKFILEFKEVIDNQLKDYQISQCCCAIPGDFDSKTGLGVRFGNLKWQNVPIAKDIAKILGNIPVFVKNDAALGGLSEAILLLNKYKRALYITISTGIGDAYIINGKIEPEFSESEAGHMVLDYEGELKTWESFASGHVLKEKYGKLASEINDPVIWRKFAHNVALGLQALISVLLPEVVIIGGGVGTHLAKFKEPLDNELKKLENNMVKTPPIVQAKRSEEAVIYGCYEYINQNV